MAKEADFYSPGEAANMLGLPERRVFGMLASGELEGHQDEWARWRIPASALQRVLQDIERSSEPGIPAGDEARPHAAEEAREDAAATTVRSDPFHKPRNGVDAPGGEEATQEEAGEAPVSGGPALYNRAESGDEETTKKLPRGSYREAAVPDAAPDETARELAGRLAAAEAEVKRLRARLELAQAAETTLRESLARERQRTDRESARAERERRAAELLQEELKAARNKGFWPKLFGE